MINTMHGYGKLQGEGQSFGGHFTRTLSLTPFCGAYGGLLQAPAES